MTSSPLVSRDQSGFEGLNVFNRRWSDMSKSMKIGFLYVLVFAAAIFTSGCGKVLDDIFLTKPQSISGAMEIGSDWKEVIPPEPLKSTKSIQYVSLKMDERIWRNADWEVADKKLQTLKYPDGRQGKIEAFIVDEHDQRYELHISGIGDGFDLGVLREPRRLDGPPDTAPDFPVNRNYVKLRIRSDIPLRLEKIEWSGYDPK